jgi:glutamate-ammonia-ligase adenylyltransferase
MAWRDISARHGVPRQQDGRPTPFIIVAYGKLGGIELGYGSDLDLVFLHGEGGAATDGERSLDAQVFFLRLTQRIVHFLTTMTPDGILYPVDTRLRPHGKDGMLACTPASFEQYQRDSAWTWEHQALVRARVVAGDEELARQFAAVRERVLLAPRDPGKLLDDVRNMRERMRSELSKGGADRFDIKQDSGGIADIEFMVQYATLRWAECLGEHLRFTDNIRLIEGLEAVGVLNPEHAGLLNSAYKAYRERMHRLSLQEHSGVVEAGEFGELRDRVSALWQQLMERADGPADG